MIQYEKLRSDADPDWPWESKGISPEEVFKRYIKKRISPRDKDIFRKDNLQEIQIYSERTISKRYRYTQKGIYPRDKDIFRKEYPKS